MGKSSARNTLHRHWQLLRLLPRYPHKITAADLRSQLDKQEYEATTRTIERDLDSLSAVFPILADDHSKPYGWSWKKDAPMLDVPGLTGPQALTFALVQRFLKPLLPASTLKDLSPYFGAAIQQLDALPKSRGLPSWVNKVRVVPPTQSLIAPAVRADVQEAVYETLLNGRQVRLVYQKRGAQVPSEYTVHPLGIVQRGPITYLVCTLFQYPEVFLFALHRILSALPLEDSVRYPKDFNLDQYIASGALEFGDGKRIRLEVLVDSDIVEHLEEARLSADQRILVLNSGKARVTATVNDTPQLTWWLLGFGAKVEVTRPQALRKSLAHTAAAMARNYRRRTR